MSTPESQGTPDFSDAVRRLDKIVATEQFLYGGDPRAVSLEGLVRKRDLTRQPVDTENAVDSKVVDIIDLKDTNKITESLRVNRSAFPTK